MKAFARLQRLKKYSRQKARMFFVLVGDLYKTNLVKLSVAVSSCVRKTRRCNQVIGGIIQIRVRYLAVFVVCNVCEN